MLKLKHVKELFPFTSGIIDDNINFRYCFTNYFEETKKGLFVPYKLNQHNTHHFLNEAINRGAIATLWQRGIPLPSYTPSMFPVFYVDNSLTALEKLMHFYVDYLNKHKDVNDKTIFLITSPLEKNKKNHNLGGIHMFKKHFKGLNGGFKEC